jgi:hypothetical protein
MVLSIVGVIVLVIIGLIGWCIYRFCKKKRPKGADEGKDLQDDENALVDNEEANVEEVRPHTLFCFEIPIMLEFGFI